MADDRGHEVAPAVFSYNSYAVHSLIRTNERMTNDWVRAAHSVFEEKPTAIPLIFMLICSYERMSFCELRCVL